jgi:hypothetical protein
MCGSAINVQAPSRTILSLGGFAAGASVAEAAPAEAAAAAAAAAAAPPFFLDGLVQYRWKMPFDNQTSLDFRKDAANTPLLPPAHHALSAPPDARN